MKLGQAVVFLFAFAKLVDAEGGVRGRELGSGLTNLYYKDHWDESTDKCEGAVCGLWGDPHLFSCDGLGFDCNAVGVFHLMKNFLYNIQVHYINVGAIEMGKVLGWNNYGKATYTSDVAIQNVERKDDDHPEPILQFSFPEFINPQPQARSEHNCFPNKIYKQYISTPEIGTVYASDIQECREKCLEDTTYGCTHFTWHTGTHVCQFADSSTALKEKPSGWERTVSGQADRCGDDYSDRGGDFPSEAKMYWNDHKYRNDGNKNQKSCPVLFMKDGELQDISGFGDTDKFYETNTTYAEFYGRNKIRVVTKTKENSTSEIILEVAGLGPGELFGCHWNVFICLPEKEKKKFTGEKDGFNVSTGLMGSPDGNTHNDWVKPDGEVIPLPSNKKGKAAFDYCTGNWCVSEDENIIKPPKGATFDDIKCIGEEYTPITEENCAVSVDTIKQYCTNHTLAAQATCEIECCLSGDCENVEDEVNDHLTTYSEDPDDQIYDDPITRDDEVKPCNSTTEYNGLPEDVPYCPSSGGEILKKLHSSGNSPEPVIYDIKQNEPHDASHGYTVSFRVNAPANNFYHTYVRYEKKVGVFANDPACDNFRVDEVCRNTNQNQVTVGCIQFPHTPPFALFDVYFVDSEGGDDVELEKCCGHDHEDYAGRSDIGIVKYSYKIECQKQPCPDDA